MRIIKHGVECHGSRPAAAPSPRHGPHASRITHHASLRRFHAPQLPRRSPAFTLVEILIAIGILGLVLTAIFSTWTAILRASKVGLETAAAVQRTRIAIHTIEDALVCAQSFGANLPYYAFVSENGNEAYLSFVARLPKSFPRSGRFGEFDVRRLEFAIVSRSDSGRQLIMRQKPVLLGKETLEWDEDEKNYPLVLAKYVSQFQVECWDKDKKEWVDEWKDNKTNQIPSLVRISLKLADSANSALPQEEITRIVSLPAVTVQPPWQVPQGGPAVPGQPMQIIPGQQPGIPPGQVRPGLPPGSQPGQFGPPTLRRP